MKPKNRDHEIQKKVPETPAPTPSTDPKKEISAEILQSVSKFLKQNLKQPPEAIAKQATEEVFKNRTEQTRRAEREEAILKRRDQALKEREIERLQKQQLMRSMSIARRTPKKVEAAYAKTPKEGELPFKGERYEALIVRTRTQFDAVVEQEYSRSLEPRYLPEPTTETIKDLMPVLHPGTQWELKPSQEVQLELRPEPKGWSPQKSLVWSTVFAQEESFQSLAKRMHRQTSNTRSDLRKSFGHLVISMPKGGEVSDHQARWMAQRHLTRLGVDIDQHAIVMFRHDNTDKQHFHVIYNRVRHDGGVHKIHGASQVCQLESAIQDKMFGIEPVIEPGTAITKGMQSALGRLSKGTLKAEIRYFGKAAVEIETVGEFAQMRLGKIGYCDQESTGGFVKHQYFSPERGLWLLKHCAIGK